MTPHQRSLLDPPRARRRDPATSKAAGLKASEFASGHAARILAALVERGPMTAKEIAERTGLTDVQVSRRGKELVEARLVTIGPDTKEGCRVWRVA